MALIPISEYEKIAPLSEDVVTEYLSVLSENEEIQNIYLRQDDPSLSFEEQQDCAQAVGNFIFSFLSQKQLMKPGVGLANSGFEQLRQETRKFFERREENSRGWFGWIRSMWPLK